MGDTRPTVVVVHSSDEMYGADRIVLEVVRSLTEHLHVEVEVWLPDDVEPGAHALSAALSDRGVTWRRVSIPVLRRSLITPRGLVSLARRCVRLRQLIGRRPPDLVYVATSACLLVAPIARWCSVQHVVLHVQELWAGFDKRLLQLCARWTTVQIAISRAVATACRGRWVRPIVVENAVAEPPHDFIGGAAEAIAPAASTVSSERRPIYVVASRWNRWKGHVTLARAWMRAQHPGRLIVLGGPPPSGHAVDVPALFDGTDAVIVGEVPDAAPYIAASDALVLPSDSPEPFGLVVIEAFAAGKPVLASSAGGPLEVVEDGTNGWLFGMGDDAALARLLDTLTVDDLAAAGRAARRTWEQRFSPDRYRTEIARIVGEELGDAYRSVSTGVGQSVVPS